MPTGSAKEDHPMSDAPAAAAGVANIQSQDSIITTDNNRIRVLAGATDSAASFELEDEDHTLGNALRYMIMKNPEVELCGYSIPHPSEPKMNLRIQTYDGTTVYDALQKGLDDLMDLCDVVTDKFTMARDAFNMEEQSRMEA